MGHSNNIGKHCEFYQLSKGLHVVYDTKTHEYKEFTFEGEDVTDDRLFSLGLQAFHFKNLEDSFDIKLEDIKKNMNPRAIATSCKSVLEEYLSEHQQLDHQVGDRLTVLGLERFKK